jgi:hypothetical protein
MEASDVVRVFRVETAMDAVGMRLTWLVVVLLPVLTHHVVTVLALEEEGGRRATPTHQGK